MSDAASEAGVLCPLVTPFAAEGAVDVDSLQRQVVWLADSGIDTLWVNGTTGEFHALSETERMVTLREVVLVATDLGAQVVTHVGAPSSRVAISLAEAAAEAGASALSAGLPYYIAYEPEESASYLRDIKAAGGLPLFLYQTAIKDKPRLPAPMIMELVRSGTLNGIKYGLGDLAILRSLFEMFKTAGVSVPTYIGNPAIIDAGILAGASGAAPALAVVAPRHCVRLAQAALSGDWARAASLQGTLVALQESLYLPSRPREILRAAALKFLLAEKGVLTSDTCAQPFRKLDAEERAYLRRVASPLVERMETAAEAPVR